MPYIANAAGALSALIIATTAIGYFYGCISAIVCCLSIILMVSLQSFLAIKQGSLRKDIAEKTDDRTFYMNEILSGIETIKMQVWENYFKKRIGILRKWEILKYLDSYLFKISYRIISTIGMKIPLLVTIMMSKISHSSFISSPSIIRLINMLMLFEIDILFYFPELLFMLRELNKSIYRIQVQFF